MLGKRTHRFPIKFAKWAFAPSSLGLLALALVFACVLSSGSSVACLECKSGVDCEKPFVGRVGIGGGEAAAGGPWLNAKGFLEPNPVGWACRGCCCWRYCCWANCCCCC